MNLTFKDGFNFGCGFFVAGLVYFLVLMFFVIVAILIITAAGISAIPH